MKTGIVGYGVNSGYHITFARSFPDLDIIGVVDKDQPTASVCATKFGIPKVYSIMKELIESSKPDVIHIVTPAQTHYFLAKEVIE